MAYQSNLRDHEHNAASGAQPHECHDGDKQQGHVFPPMPWVLCRQLIACHHELYANNDSGDTLTNISIEEVYVEGAYIPE